MCRIVNEVTKAIVENLWDECVTKHMPKSEEEFIKETIDMEQFWQFPYCWAAVDGCHIPIKCPPCGPESRKEYYNFKNFYHDGVGRLKLLVYLGNLQISWKLA